MASATEAAEEETGLFLDRYIVERQLGEGSYGKVKLAIDNETNRRVALKVIHKSTIKKPEHITRIKREVRIMRLLNHPNIVKLYDVAQQDKNMPKYVMLFQETEKDIILSIEYVEGGELFDYIVAQNRLNDKTARRIFRQILSAVDYCHQSSVIHRDLKPENLLMDVQRNIKIIDFGFVNLFDPEDTLKTFCGSPFYASPEMILGRQYVGPEVDVWSMGVILYALLTGQLPFRDVNTKDLYRKITTSTFDIPSYVPEDASHLIRKMLCVEAQHRATIEIIRSHPWVNKGFDGPPESLIPWRHKLSEPLDEKVLDTMRLYGYDSIAAKAAILASPERGPAFSLYWLLKEQEDTLKQKTLNRHNSGCTMGSSVNVQKTDSSHEFDSGSLKRGPVSRRKSISGAIRQNQLPPRTGVPMPSTNEDGWNSGATGPSELTRRAASTMDGNQTDAVDAHSSTAPYGSRPQASRSSVHTTNSPKMVRKLESEEVITASPSFAPQRRRSISAVQTQLTPGASGPSKLRRRMTEHAFNDKKVRVSLVDVEATSSSHRPTPSGDASKLGSMQIQGSIEDTVPPIRAISNMSSASTSNRASYQKPPTSAIQNDTNDKPKRRLSINLGAAISSAFTKMRTTSASSNKRQDSTVSASSTTSSTIAPRVSKSMYAADTTSSKPPAAIIQELNRAFLQTGVSSTWMGYKVMCAAQNVEFQIEICQIKDTHMHGLELRRKKGSTWTYQVVCRNLIGSLKL
ncbi:hypothetical protein HDU67_005593 [Dinochytrium kinnereticum]|nr:hypothetical protein HDU67_005593 [Dinochytrium kinnereticum]